MENAMTDAPSLWDSPGWAWAVVVVFIVLAAVRYLKIGEGFRLRHIWGGALIDLVLYPTAAIGIGQFIPILLEFLRIAGPNLCIDYPQRNSLRCHCQHHVIKKTESGALVQWPGARHLFLCTGDVDLCRILNQQHCFLFFNTF